MGHVTLTTPLFEIFLRDHHVQTVFGNMHVKFEVCMSLPRDTT